MVGALVGAIIGALLVIALIVILIAFLIRRRKKQLPQSNDHGNQTSTIQLNSSNGIDDDVNNKKHYQQFSPLTAAAAAVEPTGSINPQYQNVSSATPPPDKNNYLNINNQYANATNLQQGEGNAMHHEQNREKITYANAPTESTNVNQT
jgi:hypothetical protein